MIVLGIGCYVFDSAACIIKDGVLIAACQEERFTRQKNTGDFPLNAIKFCLKEAKINISEVDHVAFNWIPFLGMSQRFLQIVKNFPYSLNFWNSHSNKWLSMLTVEKKIRKIFTKDTPLKFKFHNINHHYSHAASSFFLSPYNDANIIVMDGSGEIASTSLMVGKDNHILTKQQINFPNSMGYLYVALTHYLGFTPDSDEYKVMALASMGKKDLSIYNKFCEIVKLLPSGKYTFDLSYFNYHKGIKNPWVSKKFIDIFGTIRVKNESLKQVHYNIAWALQKRLEDVAIHCADYLHKINPSKNLIMTGGSALNCIMNEKVREKSSYKNVWVFSAPNDSGTCIGAAYAVYKKLLGSYKFNYIHAYWGPSYTEEEIMFVLNQSKMEYKFGIEKLDSDLLCKKVASLIAEGYIIGWFQGKTEFGPRALGNRSILADPRKIETKNKVNDRIKHRENFRPFAPAILRDKADEYFESARDLPFMTFILKAKPGVEKKIPAVVHFDNTARVQTVDKKTNSKFYKLINEFYKITDIPVLLNTSFNDSGEPIVNSPKDAINSFLKTNLDFLVLENFLIFKKAQQKKGF